MTAAFGADGHVTPLVTIWVVLVGMLVLAALDVWRQEVEDVAIIAILVLAVAGFTIEGVTVIQWVGGVLAAAVAFLVYLNLGVRGVMGGGDVKLASVPAFVLGVCSPVLGVWWIAGAILIQQVLTLALARRPKASAAGASVVPAALPHVPAMAASMLIAIVAFPTLL
jgi:Flp pilus assembly protein protease CpaA